MNASTLSRQNRSLWPYAIAGHFAAAIIGIAVFITWAVKQNMDLVSSDYYEQEILFQKHIDAEARTKALGTNASLEFDAAAHQLRVQVPSAHLAQSFGGRLHLYRPSDAKLDRHLELEPCANGQQIIHTGALAAGLWKARVEWTANDESYVSETPLVIE